MQDLTPVGLSEDGRRLLLAGPAGEEFSVPVDSRLRAALRGEKPRSGQWENKMESALRPRDIQARIRAGESPEEVAAAAQTTVDAIMGFATPVLAERAHVAQTALRASVRRRSGESSSAGRTLGEATELFLHDRGMHDDDVEWDAWRRPDGRWALVATYAASGRQRHAEFTHDTPGRYVIAENDDARLLTGELREPDPAAAEGAPGPARRLSSVRSQDELPLGDDAIELVRDRASEPDVAAEAFADDEAGPEISTDTGRQPDFARVAEPDTGPEPTAADPVAPPAPEAPEAPTAPADPAEVAVPVETADADWMVAEPAPAAERPRPDADETLRHEERVEDTGDEPLPGTMPAPEARTRPQGEPATDDSGSDSGSDSGPRKKPAAKKKSRSSVPSWDEIMFGGGKGD